ncbi:MAG: hypothetical protein CM1200mP39_20480 [Dehalococcoidia bacterium]|nr:MAG: hypothetical protein CM1200mP39_20480 [Dehalococcoidia bacterium]
MQENDGARILQPETLLIKTFVDQLMIDLEENENSGYFPYKFLRHGGNHVLWRDHSAKYPGERCAARCRGWCSMMAAPPVM